MLKYYDLPSPVNVYRFVQGLILEAWRACICLNLMGLLDLLEPVKGSKN